MVERNYKDKFKEIQNLMKRWSQRKLTVLGRNTLLKSVILPKLNHLFISLPNPTDEQIKSLQQQCFSFLWNNKQDRIKREQITQHYNKGGIKAPNIKSYIMSLKLTWIRRLLVKTGKWQNIIENLLPKTSLHWTEYGSNKIANIAKNINNVFWKDLLTAWTVLLKQKKVLDMQEFQMECLWFNDKILKNNKSVYYKNWDQKGIRYITDLIDADGKFLTLHKFKQKYHIDTNFITFNGIISSISKYKKELKLKGDLKPSIVLPFRPIQISWILQYTKGCKPFYDIFNSKDLTKSNAMKKWENNLNCNNIQLQDWKIIMQIPFKCTLDTKLRWFQYRINNRILATNSFIYKIGYISSDLCTFCSRESESLEHLLLLCETTQNIWQQLQQWLNQKASLNINISNEQIIFGILGKNNNAINYILILVKFHIYKSKMQKKIPDFANIKRELEYAYKIEKYIACQNMKVDNFNKKWSTCHLLFTD